MKVYARYFEENGLGFRRDTILQFGDSWDLIGSIILINPGSASPQNIPIQPEILDKLLSFSQIDDPDSWKEFSPDPTMWQIAKLFNGQLIGENRPLNGVIQLFNLFNLRNANLSEAVKLFKEISNSNIVSIEDDITKVGDKPVYFGWGNTGKYNLKDIAEKVFETQPQQPYLNDNFNDNSFYHPRYLQMGSKKNGNVIKLLHHFYDQNQEYVWNGVLMETKHIDAGTVRGKFNELLSKIDTNGIAIKDDTSTTRLFFQDRENNELEFIVTENEGGYTAIRFKTNVPLVKDNSIDYIAIGDICGLDLIEDHKNNKNGKWFCRQSFRNLDTEEGELPGLLIEICQKFLSLKKAYQ